MTLSEVTRAKTERALIVFEWWF